MDIKGKNGSLKISVEEIEKIGENISSFINSFFSKKQNSEKKEKLLFTSTKLKRMFAKSKVIVNHTQNLKFYLLKNSFILRV